MERLPKGIYTPEFRAQAVKLVETAGMPVACVAEQLSMLKSSLCNRARAAKKRQLQEIGQAQRVPDEQELELVRLRKELALYLKIGNTRTSQ